MQVGENLFQQANGGEQVLFLEDRDKEVQSLVLGLIPVMSFTRPALVDHPVVAGVTLLLAQLLFLTGLILPPTGLLSRLRRYRVEGAARTAGRVGLLVVATYLGYFVALGVAMSGGPFGLFADSPLRRAAPYIPYLGLLLSLGALAYSVRAWRDGYWGLFRRIHYSALALATLVLFLWLARWKGVA